jgi:HEAT repeat protein
MIRRVVFAGLLGWVAAIAWAVDQQAVAQEPTVADLVARLKTGNVEAKLEAIAKLEDMGADAKPAVPALSDALAHADPKVRYHAARAFGAMGPAAADAVPALVGKLRDDDALVRAHSVRSLGLIGDASKRYVKEIGALIADKDEKVRREVPHAFLRMKPDRSITIPLFTKILEDGDPSVRNMVLQAVAETGPDAVPFLLDALARPESRYWACLGLGQIGPDAVKAVPKLLEIAEDKEPEHRMEALMALGSIKPSDATSISAIAKHLEDPFGGARFAAAYALGNIGPAAKTAGAALMKHARTSRDEFLKVTCAWALVKVDERTLDTALPILIEGARSRDPNVRSACARGLGDVKAKPATSLPALISLLGDVEKPVVGQAVEAVAAFGEEAVPLTSKALANDRLKLGAIFALKRIGPAAKAAVPDLVKAMSNEPQLDVRREVFFALASIGGSEEAIPELIKALSHENVKVRNGASYALGKIGPAAKSALPTLKRNMTSKDDEYLAMISAWAAAQIDYENPETVRLTMPFFVKGLEHREMLIRLEAANTLALFGTHAKDAVPALKKAMNDKDPNVREAVGKALKKIEG